MQWTTLVAATSLWLLIMYIFTIYLYNKIFIGINGFTMYVFYVFRISVHFMLIIIINNAIIFSATYFISKTITNLSSGQIPA